MAFDYIWGEALSELDRRKPDARIVNLETAVTYSVSYEAKGINYKMSPANVPVITAAGIDCCVLANNHVLDWGRPGLIETLSTPRAGWRALCWCGPYAQQPRQRRPSSIRAKAPASWSSASHRPAAASRAIGRQAPVRQA